MKKRSNSSEISACRSSNTISVTMEKTLGNWRDAIDHGCIGVSSVAGEVGNNRKIASPTTASCCAGTGASTTTEAYAQRLRTYKSDTYFSKPDCVSPLIAARLGWKNTSKDTLTCVNPECSACLSITFDRDPPSEATSLAAWNRLGLDYRKQLLTAHVPYCSFRCEAQCWFPPTGTDLTANTTSVVPSFLLSVIPEMILFENQSSDKVQIQLIYQTILHKSSDFDNFLVKFSTSLSNSSESRKDYRYRVVDPDPVKSFVREQKRIVNNENQPLSLDLKTLLDEWCSSHSNLTTENGGEEDVHSCHNNATIGRLYRTQQSVLLATLGWSLVASSNIQKGVSHQRNYIIVECPCCVSRALVPITTDTSDNNDDFITQEDSGGKEPSGASTKRVRVIDTTQNATRSTSGTNRMFWRTAPQSSSTKPTITAENRPMHPLTSHRHFCPYLGGSLLHNRIGWEIIINRMLQWKSLHDKSN